MKRNEGRIAVRKKQSDLKRSRKLDEQFINKKMCCGVIHYVDYEFKVLNFTNSRFQWPRGLRRGSATVRLLRLWVRIPPGAWISVCCEFCVLSVRGLCDC
jgi:hypothetical protein